VREWLARAARSRVIRLDRDGVVLEHWAPVSPVTAGWTPLCGKLRPIC
jgi:uncharacterized membrane-anchored protein